MNVINLINRRTGNLIPFGHIINNVKRLLILFKNYCDNEIFHCLTKHMLNSC